MRRRPSIAAPGLEPAGRLRRRRPFAARWGRLAELVADRSASRHRRHQPGRRRGLRIGLGGASRAADAPNDLALLALAARLCDKPCHERWRPHDVSTRPWTAPSPGCCCCCRRRGSGHLGPHPLGGGCPFLGGAGPAALRRRSRVSAPSSASGARRHRGAADVTRRHGSPSSRPGLRPVETDPAPRPGRGPAPTRLLVAFASRRAIDRGVPLGYLETLLADRFGEE